MGPVRPADLSAFIFAPRHAPFFSFFEEELDRAQ